MSLTEHLKNGKSPICQFLRTQFPNTRSFLAEARKMVRAAGTIVPDEDVPWGLIGTALDYRIRYYFGITPHEELVAYKGARRLTEHVSSLANLPKTEQQDFLDYIESLRSIPLKSEYQDFFDGLDSLLEQTPPINTRLEIAHEDALNRHCIVLALMEEAARIGPHPGNLLVKGEFNDAKALLTIVQSQWIDDLRELSWEFYDKCNPLLHFPHVLNPTFDGSVDVGGADADMIVDELLIDIKATKRSSIELDWLRQLLGYVLLDYSDQYGISGIGLYMARQGILVSWSLEEVVRSLCADNTTSIQELRAQFQECVTDFQATARDII